jgi:hypothetical protein
MDVAGYWARQLDKQTPNSELSELQRLGKIYGYAHIPAGETRILVDAVAAERYRLRPRPEAYFWLGREAE